MAATLRADGTSYRLTYVTLAAGTSAYGLLQSLVLPALPVIQSDLHASTTSVTWLLTAFLLATSIATPIAGRLGDMFGKERVLFVVLVVFAFGSLLAAVSQSIGVLILGRAFQGVGGAVFPLAFGIVRDEFPRDKVAGGIAIVSATIGVGGGAGTVLAGPIVDALSWHWLFWFPFAITSLTAAATLLVVPASPVRSPGRIDYAGAALLSLWLSALLLGVSEGDAWGWTSPGIVGLFGGAIVTAVAWVRLEERVPEPMIDISMLRLRSVWTVNVAAFLMGAAMFCAFILIPEFVEAPSGAGYGFAASVTGAGLFMLPCTGTVLVMGPAVGRVTNLLGARVALLIGLTMTTFFYVLLATAHGHPWEVYVATCSMGIGLGFALASLGNLIVQAVPPEQTGAATGMNTVFRTVGGAIGGQIAGSILSAHASARGVPTEHGFAIAFVVIAIVGAAGIGASALVPRARRALATAGENRWFAYFTDTLANAQPFARS